MKITRQSLSGSRRAVFIGLAVVALLTGCAARRGPEPGVPIEERPTPTPPPESEAAPSSDMPAAEPGPSATPPPVLPRDAPAEPPSDADRVAAIGRIVADTTAASAAVKRCSTRTLLPDQESVFESTRSYLAQTRAALVRNELWQAESLARKARQLALSLDCR
jgi:hypothetical protein